MATDYILLALFCAITYHSYRLPDGSLLNENQSRDRLVDIAVSEVGVRELTGDNDGARIEEYLSIVKLKKGQPWCAAFLSWVFAKAGYKTPRTGWSPALFNSQVNTKAIRPGYIFGIWFPDLKRIAHVGMVQKQEGDWIISVEGNTNIQGGREGDGVYRKRRHLKSIRTYANWVKTDRRGP